MVERVAQAAFRNRFDSQLTENYRKKTVYSCAAKAFYSCPAIISRRPGSQNTPKESQLNPEEDSRIKQARSHVTLEKSSKNYKPCGYLYIIIHTENSCIYLKAKTIEQPTPSYSL